MGTKKQQSRNQTHKKRGLEVRTQPKLKKDLGLPSLGSFKTKMTNKVEEQKQRAEQAGKRQANAREALHNKYRNMSSGLSLADMANQAEQRGATFDSTEGTEEEFKDQVDAAATGQKDNSKKAYFREFRKVLEHADVVLEVLDARDPLGCRTRHVERMIMDSGLSKKIILVLNKIDLVPRENVESWLKYLRNEYPAIAFKASTQSQRRNLSQSNMSADIANQDMLNSSECLGADQLIKLLKNYCRNLNMKTSITVGVIGYPNVGKSSVINSLKRSKVCGVGSTPGFTKVAQQITLDKNIKLLDCPGIVFAAQGHNGESDAEVLLRNCVKVELLDDPITPVQVIVSRCSMEQLMAMYEIPPFNDVHDFLVRLALQRGKLKKGGIPDTHLVARAVLQDWNGGKIPFYTRPPSATSSHINASLVSSWGKELDLDDLLKEDNLVLGSLKSSNDFVNGSIIMQSNDTDADGPMEIMDQDMMEGSESLMEMSTSSQNDTMSTEAFSQQPVVNIVAKTKKGQSNSGRKQVLIDSTEAQLNPQFNQSLKKQLKMQQKKARRQERSGDDVDYVDEDDMMADDDIMQNNYGALPVDSDEEEL
ncbi:hypothetical protein INT43_005697 [Umbelopsis isabellina]|uniref:CP-type G domain-containing protein n=1 Tax=Mortierella isabellina TaxID=91625 RepID=A0A8H7PLX3_MORIS|nr:hypothetical protein INT43_005697 [Umbelopsis isabellina]